MVRSGNWAEDPTIHQRDNYGPLCVVVMRARAKKTLDLDGKEGSHNFLKQTNVPATQNAIHAGGVTNIVAAVLIEINLMIDEELRRARWVGATQFSIRVDL